MTSDDAGVLRIERDLERLQRQFDLDQALLAEVHERRREKLLRELQCARKGGNSSSRNLPPHASDVHPRQDFEAETSPLPPLHHANGAPPHRASEVMQSDSTILPDDDDTNESPVAVATPPAQALPLSAAVPGSRQRSAEQGFVPSGAAQGIQHAKDAADAATTGAQQAAAQQQADDSFGLADEEREGLTFTFARGPKPGKRFQRAMRGRKLPGSLWEKLGLSKSSGTAPVSQPQEEEENGTMGLDAGFVVTSLQPHEVDSFEGLHVSMWEQALRELEDEGAISIKARRVQRVFMRPPGAPIPEEEQSIGGDPSSDTSSSDDDDEFGIGVAGGSEGEAGGAGAEDEEDEILPPWMEHEDDFEEEVSGDGSKAATENPETGEVVISGRAAPDPLEEEEKLREQRRIEHAKLEKTWQAALEAVGADSSVGAAKLRAVRQLCALRPSPPGAKEAEAADFCDVPVDLNLKLALRQEVKMAFAMTAVAEQLPRLVIRWQESRAPREEAQAWKAWQQMAQDPSVVQEWRAEAEEKLERVLELGDEVARSNLNCRSPNVIAKRCSSLEGTLFALMRLRFNLEVAGRPVPPPRPAKKRKKAPTGAANEEGGAEAPAAMEVDGGQGGEEEGSEYEADSFIVDDDEMEEGEHGPEEDAVDGPAAPDEDDEESSDAEGGGLLLPGQLRAGQTMLLVGGKNKRARAEDEGGAPRISEDGREGEEREEPASKAARRSSDGQTGQGAAASSFPQGGSGGPSTEAAAATGEQQEATGATGGPPGDDEPRQEDGDGVPPAADDAPDERLPSSTVDAEEEDEIVEIQLRGTEDLEEDLVEEEEVEEEEAEEEAMVYGKGSLDVGQKVEVNRTCIWEAGLVLESCSNGTAVLRPRVDEAAQEVQTTEVQEFMVRPTPPPYSVTNDAIHRYRIFEVLNPKSKTWATCIVTDVLGTLSIGNASRYFPEPPKDDRDPFMDRLYERSRAAAKQAPNRVICRVLIRPKDGKTPAGGGTCLPMTNFDISMGDLRIPMQWDPSTGEWTDRERSEDDWQERVTISARPKAWSVVVDKAYRERLREAVNQKLQEGEQDRDAAVEALKARFYKRLARNPFVDYPNSMKFFKHKKNPVNGKNATRGRALPEEPTAFHDESMARRSSAEPRALGFLPRQHPGGASGSSSRKQQQQDRRMSERERHFNKYIKTAESRRNRTSNLRERGREMAIAHLTPTKAMSHQDSQPLFEGEEEPRILRKISSCLKEYQWGGVRFMWNNLVREHDAAAQQAEDGEEDIIGGCILAHSMGLGKTLQTIAFLSTFHSSRSPAYSIVVVPANVLVNWEKEFDQWLGSSWLKVLMVPNKKMGHRVIEQWSKVEEGAVLLITYDILAGYVLPGSGGKGRLRKTPTTSTEAANQAALTSELLRSKPDVVVADEAHELRNEKSNRTKAMMKFSTKRRVALTGYPLQNNLKEYWVMMQWTREGILPPLEEFNEDFCQPINEGQFSKDDRKRNDMLDTLSVLDDLCRTMRQRMGPEVLLEELKRAGASKKEHVLLFQLSPLQEELYNAYLEGLTASPMADLAVLTQIINCPHLFIERIRGSAADPQGGIWEEDNVCNLLLSSDDEEDAKSKEKPKRAQISTATMQRMRDIVEAALPQGQSHDDWSKHVPKMAALDSLVEACRKADEKLVVFTESTRVLNDMEQHLDARGWKKAPEGAREFRPEPRTHYFMRLEGSTASKKRQAGVKRFNEQGNSVLVYLMSTKAGSLGINLTSAFRMVIWDCPWNPCHNAQAVARIFRIGQTKRCFVYRMLYENTTEHHIYHRTLGKESLFSTVVDSKTTIAQSEKAELFKREPPQPRDADLGQQIADKQDPMLAEISEACNALLRVKDHQELLAPDMDYQVFKIDRKSAAKRYMLRSAEKEQMEGQPAGVPAEAAPGSASKKSKKTSGKSRWKRLRKIRELEEEAQEHLPLPAVAEEPQQQQVPAPPVPVVEQQQQGQGEALTDMAAALAAAGAASTGFRQPAAPALDPAGFGGASGSDAANGSTAAASTALIDEAGILDVSKEQPHATKQDVAAPSSGAAAANGASTAPGSSSAGAGGDRPPGAAASNPVPPAPLPAHDDDVIDLCDDSD